MRHIRKPQTLDQRKLNELTKSRELTKTEMSKKAGADIRVTDDNYGPKK